MIKVNVLCEDYSWTKRIKKKKDLFNEVCKKFPKNANIKSNPKNGDKIKPVSSIIFENKNMDLG